jgi:hypothetical protein
VIAQQVKDDIMYNLAHAEFTSQSKSAESIACAITEFVRACTQWRLLEAESAEYARSLSQPALMVESTMGNEYAGIGVAIAEPHEKRGQMRIYNVVPRQGQLTVDQYNCVVKRFVVAFRRFSKKDRLGISTHFKIPRVPTKLHEIIPGSWTRRFFERFLAPGMVWGTPTTTHPNDIERLDLFICALHRFRSHVHLAALGRWLMEEKRWPQKDADWTCNRIQIGLEILDVNNRF